MHEITLEAEIRRERGKQTRHLRRDGKVPGVFYIHGEENVTVSVPERSLHELIHSTEAHIISLKLNDGSVKSCILRDVQFDPVTDRPVHIDLQGLRADEKLTVEVPIVIVGGTPVGVKEGGILQSVMHMLKISCLPKDIPAHVEINAEQLAINHSVHVRDLKLENVTILDNADKTIVAVIPPTVEVVEEPAAVTEEITEPEVIGKGKKEEEGEEEAAEPKKGEEGTRREGKTEPAAKPAAAKKEEKKKEEKK